MGRKTKIDKNMILEAAFELLDEGGIEAVAIKSIAAKLGCSTQPISWHFGSMMELKKELFFYTADRLYGDLASKMEGKPAFEAFFVSGVHYISLACDHPNSFRFLNVDPPEKTIGERINGNASIFASVFDKEAASMISREYNIPDETINEAVRDVVIYAHGLAMMMMYDNYKMPKETACKMMFDAGVKLISGVGIDTSLYRFEDFMGALR